jgi:hypothetical protein
MKLIEAIWEEIMLNKYDLLVIALVVWWFI